MNHSNTTNERERRGIQSIEVGGRILQSLVRSGEPMMLKDLAREADMSPAQAHQYLVSLGKIGLVEQNTITGRYELGQLALQMGLISLQRLDPLRIAVPEVASLATRIGHTVALAVWGNRGPTIVRIEESANPIHVNMRTGTVMSVPNSATGQVFAAYMPAKLVELMVMREVGESAVGGERVRPAMAHLEALAAEARRHGMARAVGNPIPGINALCAPVFDHTGHIVLAITALGPAGLFDPEWDGDTARAVRECAETISTRLGFGINAPYPPAH